MKATLILLLLSTLALTAGAAEIDPGLAAHVAAGETVPTWVFFTDRDGAERDPAALAAARDALSPRALARRAKVRAADRIVDADDLPPARAYMDWLSERGIFVRAESRWLNAVSVLMDAAALAELADAPFVRKLMPLTPSRRLPSEARPVTAPLGGREDPIDYGLNTAAMEQIGVPDVHQTGNHGEGVVVGMLDTGYWTEHEALEDLDILAVWDFINGDSTVVNEDSDPEYQHNHGTYTLSALAGYEPGVHVGVAFGASFYLAKTEDVSQEEPIEEDWWVEGIEWLESVGCDLVSSSLGYIDWYTYEDLDGNTAVTTIAADHAVSLGMAVFNSAGNSRNTTGTIIAPADGDSVIAVGAVNIEGEFASFSSPGPTYDGRIKPDICALGVENRVALPGSYDEYGEVSGTSLSCPLAAGVAALVLSARPELTPMQLRDAMRETASQASVPDNDYGWGILNAPAAVQYGLTTAAGPADAPARFSAWPNPFNPRVSLRFALDREGPVRLCLYDLAGRRLAVLVDEVLAAGEHERTWKAADGDGRPLASGVYLAKLETSSGPMTKKLVLLR